MSDVALDRTKKEADAKAKQLPDPSGFHILCMVPKIEHKFGEILEKPAETVRVDEQTTVVLYVCKIGPDAYKDRTKFPSGPWCHEGDFIVTRAYAGTRLRIHGTEWRIINDDTVEAVVQDPRGIARA
jgi:co-chaperonin GroES (HSP10)